MVAPMGFSPGLKMLFTTVCPKRQTLAALVTSELEKTIPSFKGQFLISRYEGLTPCMVVDQFSEPLIAWPLDETAGDTPLIYCACFSIAFTSAMVSVCTEVASRRTPAVTLLLGRMVIILDPMLDSWS